jgi:hypothetical protein
LYLHRDTGRSSIRKKSYKENQRRPPSKKKKRGIHYIFVYKKNQMSTDRESGRGNKRARVTRGYSITESKAQQKESTTLCTNLAD